MLISPTPLLPPFGYLKQPFNASWTRRERIKMNFTLFRQIWKVSVIIWSNSHLVIKIESLAWLLLLKRIFYHFQLSEYCHYKGTSSIIIAERSIIRSVPRAYDYWFKMQCSRHHSQWTLQTIPFIVIKSQSLILNVLMKKFKDHHWLTERNNPKNQFLFKKSCGKNIHKQ